MQVQPVDNFSGSKDLVEAVAHAGSGTPARPNNLAPGLAQERAEQGQSTVSPQLGQQLGQDIAEGLELVGPVRPRGHRQRGEPRRHRDRRLLAMQLLQATAKPEDEYADIEDEGVDSQPARKARRRGAAIPGQALEQLRGLALSKALDRLGLYHSRDREYQPAKDTRSVRVLVTVEATVIELIITGKVWFDTRAAKGGRGCVDLVMHLLQLDFAQAVAKLLVQEDTHRPLEARNDGYRLV